MKLVTVLAASCLSVAAFAQNVTTSVPTEAESVTAGLIGKRYVAAGFGWTDINNSSVEEMTTGLAINLPVHTNFDVSLNYGYSWLEGNVGLGHQLSTDVTGYITRGQDKFFATGSLGYLWLDNERNLGGDHSVWGASVGVERAINDKLAVTVSGGYSDDFGQHRDSLWKATIGASYNLTSSLVATAGVSYLEGGSYGYTAGIAFRF